MAENKFVVHNRGLSQILFSSQWSLRSIFKHLLVIAYVVLITLILFKFDSFKTAFKDTISSGNGSASLSDLTNLIPQIVWDLLLVFVEMLFLKLSLKMLQLSNRNTLVFIPFALITLGVGIFTVLFLPDWMATKFDGAKGIIAMIKVIGTYSYIFLMIPGLTIIWLIANAINERRISPFVSVSNLLNIFSLCVWCLTFGVFYWLLKILVLGEGAQYMPDKTNMLQMFLCVAFVVLIVCAPLLSWKLNKGMKKRTNFKFFDKNVVQGMTVTMIAPIAIWWSWSLGDQGSSWVEWLYVGIVSFCTLVAFGYSFIKRTEAGSPKIFMVLISLLLSFIWMSKFFFEFFWGYRYDLNLTMPIALIGTTALMIVVYFKSPMVSNRISFMFLKFMETIWTVVLASWVLSFIPGNLSAVLDKFLPEVKTSLNLALLSMPIFALAVTFLYWYVTQWKIKTYSVMRLRNMSKRQIKKENEKELKKEISNKKTNKYKEQKAKLEQLKNDKLNRKTNKVKRKEVANV